MCVKLNVIAENKNLLFYAWGNDYFVIEVRL
jgi:hypothetical protein